MRVMSGEAAEARARPASGLWTLLAWLRRGDGGSDSDSLSSAGSDRTAASFAFLAPPPARRPPAAAAPAAPAAPATDSYRRRLHDCDLRRQRDRNLTLHRKYGLYYGYDAFSLPPARKNPSGSEDERNRDRRATSESLPRRTAYVPGKRRAPLPPARPLSVASASSLTRRHGRKRPAPPPPVVINLNKENTEMQSNFQETCETKTKMKSNAQRDRRPFFEVNENGSNDTKNKFCGKENNVKDNKVFREKSFLKQIFENKKRNSTIEPTERLLPNISELDRQAAEIIESCKLKPVEHNGFHDPANPKEEVWFCTRCLRKYNSTVVTCQYCLPEQKNAYGFKGENSTQTEKQKVIDSAEKQKLKEMLKEIKDSLPKRSKPDNDKSNAGDVFRFDSTGRNSSSTETATLRIGAGNAIENYTKVAPSTSKSDRESLNINDMKQIEEILPTIKPNPVAQNVVITQHVVLVAPQSKVISKPVSENSKESNSIKLNNEQYLNNKINKDEPVEKSNDNIVEINKIQTPLKISSLINPVYVPKNQVTTACQTQNILSSTPNKTSAATGHVEHSTVANKPLTISSLLSSSNSQPCTSLQTGITIVKTSAFTKIKPKLATAGVAAPKDDEKLQKNELAAAAAAECASASNERNKYSEHKRSESSLTNNDANINKINRHSKRRNLINQLEQSIANGDEKAAAEAAARLAKLRISCSVLSYASKIMSSEAVSNSLQKIEDVKQTMASTQPQSRETLKVNTFASTSNEGVYQQQQKAPSHSQQSDKKNNVCAKSLYPSTEENDTKKSQQPMNKVNVSVQSIATTPLIFNKELKASYSKDLNNLQVTNKASDIKISAVPSTSKTHNDGEKKENSDQTTIQVWVEDRESTRGPLRLVISRQALMGDLRKQAEASFGLAGALQRWIIGRALCTDDRTPLASLAGPNLSTPFYLCVVAAENNEGEKEVDKKTTSDKKTGDVYSELVRLEQKALIVNTDEFECGVCMEHCAEGNGAVLRECIHIFCRECLSDLVRHSEEPVVACPAVGCPGVLQEREIRALVSPEDYERWLARGLAAAESGTRNAFHCRTRDCTGWALFDPEVRRFPCPVCKLTNCIPCQAIHEGETCAQYNQKLQEVAAAANSPTAQSDEGTIALLEKLIEKGEALRCPECSAIITKKWGCDWIKCSACKTEICWVTRGRRWGPGGKGDTSGGCRCGVDGKRCHPSCGYCH